MNFLIKWDGTIIESSGPGALVEARIKGETRMTFKEWLTAWANSDEGEPETEWQKGYDAARGMVRIQIKCEEKPE